MRQKAIRWIALLGALALVVAACTNEEPTDTTAPDTTQAPGTTEAPTTTAATDSTESPDTTADAGMMTGIGVTEEPCPDGNPDRGCIYLGILTDESGPFAAASPGLVAGQRVFWATVNAEGGIGGAYDVALPDDLKKDTQYNPEVFVQSYNDIAGDVAAVAMSLGSPQSIAALDSYERDSTVAAPMSWWSGWAFEEEDRGLIVEFGTNYCFEAMNAFDWSMEAVPASGRSVPATVGILAFPTEYGADYAEGVKMAAEANGVEVAWEAPVIPISAGGDPQQVEAVQQVIGNPVDVIYLVTGPSETAAIVGGAVSQGATNLWIGASPTWNVGILESPAAPVFEAGVYFQSGFVGPFDYDSVGHEKMRGALTAAGIESASDFFTSGWVSQYGLKAALEAAFAADNLTREGIAGAVGALTEVDYEGMMPSRSFEGAPNDVFPRESLVSMIDPTASSGVTPVQDFFVGPTAESLEFTEPCAGIPGS